MSNLYFNNGNNKNQMFFYYGYISIVGKNMFLQLKRKMEIVIEKKTIT